jgi:hypothetical protein
MMRTSVPRHRHVGHGDAADLVRSVPKKPPGPWAGTSLSQGRDPENVPLAATSSLRGHDLSRIPAHTGTKGERPGDDQPDVVSSPR